MSTKQTSKITENGIKYEVCVYRGDRYWYLNGERHRENGPAVERSNGDRFWYLNDEWHREDGPAYEYADGTKDWYWNGAYLTDEVQEQGIHELEPDDIRFWLPILAAKKRGVIRKPRPDPFSCPDPTGFREPVIR